jgi:hypothetical protein
LEHLRAEQEGTVFTEKSVQVSCLGGGPGSDVLAIHKYLGENHRFEPVERLRCYLVDREQAWGDTWAHLDELMSTTVKVSTHFLRCHGSSILGVCG